MSDKKITYSYHHFLWPFRWDVLPKDFKKDGKKEDIPFDERTDLKTYEEFVVNKDSPWKRKQFEINDDAEKYNEFTYFLSFVRKSIFDSKDASTFSYETMRYYEYQLSGDNYYEITLKKTDNNSKSDTEKPGEKKEENDNEPNKISLTITGITIHIFNTGVGILSFDLANQDKNREDRASILLINEVGRRIYPQFLGNDGTIQKTQEAFLAVSIKLQTKENQAESKDLLPPEDFKKYELSNKKISVTNTFLPPAFIGGLFSADKFIFHVEENLPESKILLSRVMDDRMFFHCWYGNKGMAESVDARCYKSWDWWYAFIFGDKEYKSIANTKMQEEHLLKHTYARWSDYGTLYGMSHDSFVCLSTNRKTIDEKKLPQFDTQMNTMYYQVAVLCLAQRASILKFSAEVANLSDMEPDDNAVKNLITQTKNIYWNYIQFKNKVYFREVTSQIQGIEMYSQFQDVMNIPAEVEVLENKIETLHNYLNLKEGESMNREMHRLTWVATFFLPAGFIASLFGVGLISEKTGFRGEADPKVWIAWGIICTGFLISLFILYNKRISSFFKKKK